MALLLLVGVLGFAALVIIREWDTLVAFPWQFKWEYLLGFALMHSLASGSLLLAWHLMMRRLAEQTDWRGDFSIYSLSLLARRLPTAIWYVGGRVYLYGQRKVPPVIVLGATGLEAALLGIAGIICYFLLLPWYTYAEGWPWQVLLAPWVIVLAILALRPNLLIELVNWILRRLDRPLLDVSITRSSLTVWSLVYLSTWFLDGLGLYLVVAALLPSPPPLPDVIGVSTVSALVALASLILPGGLGLKELTMSVLLSAWMPLSAAVTISIFYRIAQTVVEAFWAVVGHRVNQGTVKQGEQPNNSKITQRDY
jgi:hypothetical protein